MVALAHDFVTAREASNSLAKVMDRARTGAPQVITRGGKPAAVVIDPATFDAMQQAVELEAESLRILADAAAVRADRGEGVDADVTLNKLQSWRTARGLPAVDLATVDPAEYLDLDEPDAADT